MSVDVVVGAFTTRWCAANFSDENMSKVVEESIYRLGSIFAAQRYTVLEKYPVPTTVRPIPRICDVFLVDWQI